MIGDWGTRASAAEGYGFFLHLLGSAHLGVVLVEFDWDVLLMHLFPLLLMTHSANTPPCTFAPCAAAAAAGKGVGVGSR